MACVQPSKLSRTWHQIIVLLVFCLTTFCAADPEPQLDLPQITNQRNPYGGGYGLLSSTQTPLNSPGNQYAVSQNPNYQFSTPRPSPNTPGVYPVSSTPTYNGNRGQINPDISNNGYPNLDYSNGNNPNQGSSTFRPFDDRNRDDRIDINNDPNFRRNDPNFVRNDPNYVGTNPYDFNRGVNPDFPATNNIDNRIQHVNLQQVRDFLHQADEQASKECTNNVAAQWNFETEVNDATQHAAVSQILYDLERNSKFSLLNFNAISLIIYEYGLHIIAHFFLYCNI